jgi:hypothetical protein
VRRPIRRVTFAIERERSPELRFEMKAGYLQMAK